MISLIVSTYNSTYFQSLSDNVEKSIGTDFEIIGIENFAQYSLCEAYNIGAGKAKYPYLCFLHEDILFRVNNWGKHLISVMESDSSIGLIGVAGTKFKSTYPTSSWAQSSFFKKYRRGHIYLPCAQHREFDLSSKPLLIEDVVCLDGVFLFTKKDVYQTCKFDDKTFTDFHGYDLDFSLQVLFNSYRVVVDRRIEIIHFSKGNYNPHFLKANRLLQRKWSSELPVASRVLSLSRFQQMLYNIINNMFSLADTLRRKLVSKTTLSKPKQNSGMK